jgi:hypothetical protein
MTADVITPVVLTTADGESREARMWPDGSYTCPFCDGAVVSPEGHEEGERLNAAAYEKMGEPYQRQPYSESMRRAWQDRRCANPACLTVLGAEALARVRQRIAERQEYERAEAERRRFHDEYAAQQRAEREARVDAARAASERDGWCLQCWAHETSWGLVESRRKPVRHRSPENCPRRGR